MAETRLVLPRGYASLLNELKDHIRAAQVRAALAVNRELVLLYWSLPAQLVQIIEAGCP